MIGTRALAAALAGTVALVPLIGAGGPDPAASLGGHALVIERALTADDALAELETVIAPALDLSRSGAARVVSGDAPPGEALRSAGEMLTEAEPAARRAVAAVRALEGARRALGDSGAPLEPPVENGELGSIGGQLDGTATAADRFAAMRRRADGVLGALATTIEALGAGDPASAERDLRAARADHAAIAAWQVNLVTLPIWIEAAGALLDAAESLLAASAAGDRESVAAAAAEVAAQSPGAASADRALRIAMAEGGASVTAAPLSRLADLLRRTAEARLAVAEILHGADR